MKQKLTSINRLPAYWSWFLLFLSVFSLNGQVYNFEPVHYRNTETNPSALSLTDFSASLRVMNHFFIPAGVNCTNVRATLSSSRYFCGVGISLTHLSVGKMRSTTEGAGVGYRTILFDQLFLRAGVFYKLNSVFSPAGYFKRDAFITDSAEPTGSSKLIHNFNFSFSLASEENKAYINAGVLNYSPGAASQATFQRCAYLSLGDLGRMVSDYWTISYTLLVETVPVSQANITHYLNVQNKILVNRNLSAHIGGRAGVDRNGIFHLNPLLDFHFKSGRKRLRRFFTFQFMYDVYAGKNAAPQGFQFSITSTK